MPGLSADSLEDVSREAEATPGLQQLTRVLPIQLQFLYGADDLCMHVSNHTHTHIQCAEGRRERMEGGKKNDKRRKEREKKNVKRGVGEHQLGHLRRKHTTAVTQDKNTHCKMVGCLLSRGTSCSAHP